MPHCSIEFSKELEEEIAPQFLINSAHQGALESGLFEESHIKSRAIAYDNYKTGISDLRFIHITARILSGRNLPQKANLSKSILAEFETLLLDRKLTSISITVEICDLQREAYSKVIL